MAKIGQLIEAVDVEKILPIATAIEKRLSFQWETVPSQEFLMGWNQRMEPNSMFVENLDERGITVTVRWGVMKETPEQIRERLNKWLAKVEDQSHPAEWRVGEPFVKHFLSVEQLSPGEIDELLALARLLKATRMAPQAQPLARQIWALIFTKLSTRTRVSFEVGVRELGGTSLHLSGNDIQMGRGETVADTARVMSRYVHGAVIRTFAQKDVEEFAQFSTLPVINALTDDEHPCQILADLLTISEKLGSLKGKKVAFIGDAACNVCNSWLFAAAKTGLELWTAAPGQFQPRPEWLKRAGGGVQVTADPLVAARGADVVYTDVWVSMGKEAEAAERAKILAPYQINDQVVKAAKPGALIMHCLPAYRGKEITAGVFEAHQQTIFDQAENRLHVQKAILVKLAQAWRR